MKEYECVLVSHHKGVAKTIIEWEKKGWRLRIYTCAGNATVAMGTNHYLLFERGE